MENIHSDSLAGLALQAAILQDNNTNVISNDERVSQTGLPNGNGEISVDNQTNRLNSETENFKTEFILPNEFKKEKVKKTKTAHLSDSKSSKCDQLQSNFDKETRISDITAINMVVPYQEPEWSGISKTNYTFDVLKNGSIIGTISLSNKPFYIFGRLPSCDITLEHPSLSRYHAVIQYAAKPTSDFEKGWYIYDLDSTHGTWVNKIKISPKVYHRLKVGYIVKFGGSSRLHILQGPQEDADEESEMTIMEMKAQKEQLQKQAEFFYQLEIHEEMKRTEEQQILDDKGCSWGMSDDAVETGDGANIFASLVAENENLYIDDPKKALKGFYEREGCDLPDYQFTELSVGKHKCRLELPVDGPNGEELIAEAIVSGKRKDAVVACALEACRILDSLGLLRSSTHESRKRKQKKWEDDDYYDSDEDTFLDRTGTIENKRVLRMKKAGKDEPETYDSLLEKYNAVIEQIMEIEKKLQKAKAESEALASDEMDELDAYMVSIKSGLMDTKTRLQLKGDLLKLKGDEQKLRKLVNIVKPPTLPPLKPLVTGAATPCHGVDKSRKLHAQQKKIHKIQPIREPHQMELKPDDYEEKDDEEEDSKGKSEEGYTCSSTEQKFVKAPVIDESLLVQNHPSSSTMKPHVHAKKKTENKIAQNSRPLWLQSTASALGSLKKSKSAIVDVDPNYAVWLPPPDQAGDGRTKLNDKLGY